MKKIALLLITITLMFSHITAQAQNTNKAKTLIVGTSTLALLAGIPNIYVQTKISNNGALVGEYTLINNAEIFGSTFSANAIGGAYKYYFNQYNAGLFLKGGIANISITSGSSTSAGLIPIILAGYENKLNDQILLGIELGIGTTAGTGLLSINVGTFF